MTDQTPEAQPEPTPEEQRESLTNAQQQGETTSPQAQAQQERDAAEPNADDVPADANPGVSDAEQATRAAHSAEGGGAWPPELLVEHGTVPGQPVDAAELHEQQAREAEDAS